MYRHQWNTRWAFAREPVTFTYEKITFAMGLYNKSRLSQKKLLKWNGLVFHWCLYHKLNITWLLGDTKFIFEWWIILYLGCVRWGNLDLDFKTDFNAEIFVFGFSFLPFDWEIQKIRIWISFFLSWSWTSRKGNSKSHECENNKGPKMVLWGTPLHTYVSPNLTVIHYNTKLCRHDH